MKKIVMTGGGTGGHVTPNLALIPRLMADGWDISVMPVWSCREGISFPSSYPVHAVSSVCWDGGMTM